MTFLFLRSLRPLLFGGMFVSGLTLLNCSSGTTAANVDPTDAAAQTDSSVAAPDVIDAGVTDGPAPITQAELSAACLEGNTRGFLRCYGDFTKAGVIEYLPANCDARAAKSFLPGVTEEYRLAQKACEDSRGTFCSGSSPACRALGPLFGTLPDGTACQDSAQCSSGLCFGARETACGTCTQPLPIGGDCSGVNSKRCSKNAACDNGVCALVTLVEAGAECSLSRSCREGNVCATAGADSGVQYQCKPDRTPLQTCEASGVPACAPAGTYACVGGRCDPRPIEGGTCDAKLACRSGFVCDNGLCRKGNVDVAIGAPCKPNADACIAGASCSKYDSNTKTSLCVAYAKVDESCGSGVASCAPPLVCDGATLLCRQTTLTCP